MTTTRRGLPVAGLMVTAGLIGVVACAAAATFALLGQDAVGSLPTEQPELAELRRDVDALTGELEQLAIELRALANAPARVREDPHAGDRVDGDGPVEPIADAAVDARGDDDEPGRRGRARGGEGEEPSIFSRLRQLRDGDDATRAELARQILAGDGEGKLFAAYALLELSPAEGVDAIRALIESGAITEASGRFGGRDMLGRVLDRFASVDGIDAATELRALYDSGDAAMRAAAARALEKAGDASLTRRLLDEMGAELYASETGVRLGAIDAMAATRSPLVRHYVQPLLTDGSVEVRLRALDALRRTGTEQDIAMLEVLLDDPVARVRERAEQAITSLRDPDRGGRGNRGGRDPGSSRDRFGAGRGRGGAPDSGGLEGGGRRGRRGG